jgi:hypothetical protein
MEVAPQGGGVDPRQLCLAQFNAKRVFCPKIMLQGTVSPAAGIHTF